MILRVFGILYPRHFLSFRYRRREEFEHPRPGVVREGGAGGQEGGGYIQGGAERPKMCLKVVNFIQYYRVTIQL